ncbi:large ribosomal subunit protein bL9m [Genypterus blacodes]|uniref:large ribosomal subunit protein bL9m n=1 Tax=Genypterus blacodes TaxID=154954 RepID=UPI003F766D1C
MWSSGRRVLQELLLLSQPAARRLSLTATQNTVVVERCWHVPLSKVDSPPRLHPRRHRIYKLVEDTKNLPQQNMELILTQTVPKLGGRGDTVFVKKSVGRNKLLPQGLAVYPSPDNKQIFAEELRLLREGKPEDRIQTRTGQLTVEFLKRLKLKINKVPSDEFQLSKELVCRHFLKKCGVVVPSAALRLPDEPISDLGDYWCEVTVNGIDTVRISMSLVPYENPSASHQRLLRAQKLEQAAADASGGVTLATVEAASLPEAAFEAEEVTVKAASVPEAAFEAEEVTVKAASVPEAAFGAEVEAASVPEAAFEAEVEAAPVPEAAFEAEEATVKAASVPEAAFEAEEATVKAASVPEAAFEAEEATVEAASVPEAAFEAEEATVKASSVPEAAFEAEEATVKASSVPEAAFEAEEATVKASSVPEAAFEAEEAKVEAGSVPEASVEAEASKDAVSSPDEASEADPPRAQHTPSDAPKKD